MGDTDCPTGFSCCNGTCASFGSSPLHCGSCEKSCADEQDCINGECGEGSGCKGWLADCDKNAGCEVNLRNDPKHCGDCATDCGTKRCSGGSCTDAFCSSNTADCDNNAMNGCETLLTSTDNCGVCHNECSSFHGTPVCNADFTCGITCEEGFSDCDDNPKTGCETDVTKSDTNCGSCDVVCFNANGATQCNDGVCVPRCNTGFADCDGNPNNGCETNLQDDEKNCGECSKSCVLPHSTGTCVSGVCQTECEKDYDDCNGGDDGCESHLTEPETCGKCSSTCNSNGGDAKCTNGACSITCTGTNRDCVNGPADGCETNIATNIKNCGNCGIACADPAPGNSVACVDSRCVYSNCAAPLADCDGNTTCETNLTSDAKNCGGCGLACTAFNGTAACVNSKCVVASCNPGYADCDPAADGCETKLGDRQNCTECKEACLSDDHTKNSCTPDGCSPTCAVGWGNCDGIPDNGCETQLNTLTNCGQCLGSCKLPNAATSCDTGTCTITSCTPGWGDCNGELADGCETPLTTNQNCGACRKPCEIPNATTSCATGTCQAGACMPGFGDCSSTLAGCETPLGTTDNCSKCKDACEPNHVTQNLCVAATPTAACTPTCSAGYKSCDGIGSNGCETNINTPENCGDCNAACSLPNAASYTCPSGSCVVATCKPGFAHCDTSQANGCEQATSSDINHCGSCTTQCSAVNGTPKCTSGTCSTVCNAGWGDCNGKPLDGCEQDTTSDPNFCGNCTTKCTGGTPFCVSSACKAHLTIGVVMPPANAQAGNLSGLSAPLTVTHTLKNGPEARRLVVIGIATRGNGSFAKPASVRYGTVSTAPTLQKEITTVNQAWAGIYTLPNSVLPAATTMSNVTITFQTTGDTFGAIANVLELTNVDQTNPIDALGGTAHGQCNGSVIDTISTATDGALVYSVLSMYGNSVTAPGTTSGQTVLMPFQLQANTGGIAGALSPGGPINNMQFIWGAGSCFTAAQALVAFRPAVTLAF